MGALIKHNTSQALPTKGENDRVKHTKRDWRPSEFADGDTITLRRIGYPLRRTHRIRETS